MWNHPNAQPPGTSFTTRTLITTSPMESGPNVRRTKAIRIRSHVRACVQIRGRVCAVHAKCPSIGIVRSFQKQSKLTHSTNTHTHSISIHKHALKCVCYPCRKGFPRIIMCRRRCAEMFGKCRICVWVFAVDVTASEFRITRHRLQIQRTGPNTQRDN